MARSIHITKKDLKRERYFAASDGVSWGPEATHAESEHIKKLLCKDNEEWRRAAQKKKLPAVGKLKLEKGEIVYKRIKKRAPKPEQKTEVIS